VRSSPPAGRPGHPGTVVAARSQRAWPRSAVSWHQWQCPCLRASSSPRPSAL
jgi:hypothetical protein